MGPARRSVGDYTLTEVAVAATGDDPEGSRPPCVHAVAKSQQVPRKSDIERSGNEAGPTPEIPSMTSTPEVIAVALGGPG